MLQASLWTTVEIAFESEQDFDNPFWDVDLEVEFIGPDRESIIRPAFWDGGRTWRVRFTPTRVGDWVYRAANSTMDDRGLGGVNGAVHCVRGDAVSGFAAHGFLRVSTDGSHLAHVDGRPFFWLGDTHWRFAWESWDGANKAGWSSQFRGMVDRRVDQGFSVYQTNVMSFGGEWSPSSVWAVAGDFTRINVAYFHEILDPRMSYIAERGLLNAVGLAWFNRIDLGAPGMVRLARYFVARYGSYPVVWTLGGEVAGYDPTRRQERIEAWRQVALGIREADGYRHPITAHLTAERPIASYYQDEDWLDLTLHQHGHGDLDLSPHFYREQRQKHPRRPLVEGESLYEGLVSVEPAGRRIVTDTMVRQAAYRSIQSGCCGYTYGAQGCWNAAWDRSDGASMWGDLPWHEGIDLPGGEQLGHLRRLYESLDWTRLRPCDSCFATTNVFNASLYRPLVTADADRTTVVAYFGETYRRGQGQASLTGISPGPYDVFWFDPRLGTSDAIYRGVVPQGGRVAVPDPPDDRDWVLIACTLPTAARV